MPDESFDRGELLALTAEIVAAHVGNNAVASAELGGLIQAVFDTLRQAGFGRTGGAGGADPGGADPPLGDRRSHRLPRVRQEAEDAEAAPPDRP